MKSPGLLSLLLVLAGPAASAEPSQLSQHPRVGELCEIRFTHDSATVPHNVDQKLGEVAGWAKQNPDGLIVLDGHADHSGQSATEVTLALQRAEAVRDQLVKTGVDPDQIVVAAFGADSARTDGNARVVVWGTHQDIDGVVANRKHANAIVAGR